MAVLLNPLVLQNPEHPPVQAMRDALWNMCSEYIIQWGQLPRFCYMNDRLWNDDLGKWMQGDMEELKLDVVTHPDMPPDRISVHHEFLDPKRIAKWHREFSADDGLESGRLSLQ